LSDLTALYVHVPFCVKKCAYCDFYSVVDLSLVDGFVRSLTGEIALRGDHSAHIDTVYFGGGTPSLLSPDRMERILGAIGGNFTVSEGCEITMEVNPGTVDFHYFQTLRRSGVNRLNLGVQSFSDDRLNFMGRIHSAAVAQKALSQARDAGFDNIGLDLIYGLPGDSEGAWIMDLDTALGFRPEHLSCYMLSYEPGTPMHGLVEGGTIVPLGDGAVAGLFKLTSNYLCDRGYIHYEISNFAAGSSHQSRHNQKYWNHVPYLGFGPSAHSFQNGVRSSNHRDVCRYTADLGAGRLPVAETETLTRDQILIEMIMLGLRTAKGVNLKEFDRISNRGFLEMFSTVVKDYERKQWGRVVNQRFFLTLDGRLFLDTIVAAFVDIILGSRDKRQETRDKRHET
jgi:oxygen-independent coproporphyrinogen-3 oxidase